MDELILLARLRGDVPCDVDLVSPQRRLADEIAAATGHENPAITERGLAASPARGTLCTAGTKPARARGRRARRRFVAATAALAVAAAVAVIVAARTGETGPSAPGATTTIGPVPTGSPRPAATAAELVADATRAAQASPDVAPNTNDWVYTKTERATSASTAQNGTLLGPVNGTVVSQEWSRPDPSKGGTPGTWQGTSYSYFSSLPANPAQLAAVIDANNKTDNYVIGGGALGVFNDVEALLEQPDIVLPLKLRAALYAVLASEPGVNFQPHVTDIAGRTDVAFSIDQEGYDRAEILINPTTYSYMGQLDLAYQAHAFPAQINNGVASGAYTYVRAGQIMDEEAQLQFAIVSRYGQLPQ